MPKKKIEIPKQPERVVSGLIWMATYHTVKFCFVILTIVFCIIALSIEYTGKNIKKDKIKVMEKIHERTNR